jgi:hypothetical protein
LPQGLSNDGGSRKPYLQRSVRQQGRLRLPHCSTIRGKGHTQGGTTYPRKEEVCGPRGRGPTPSDKGYQSKEIDEAVGQALLSMPTILIAPLALVWLVNHPDYQLPKQSHVVLYGTNDCVLTEALTEDVDTGSDVEMDHPTNNLFSSSNSDWSNKRFSENSRDDWSRAVVDGIDRLSCDGGLRGPKGSRTLVAATRSRVRAFAEALLKQELLLRLKHKSLRSRAKCPSVQPRSEPRLACEAGRRLKWLPFRDHHLLTLTSSGLDSKTQPRSLTGGVC